ncbi:MAG: tRNA epoxyqueuosine(34) reductase QueG [Candidatus Tectomicrobia bacterium RIFCSPLOWO2_12_FULL_69_37]|nr:MAG: tRNA epoxyqueuosine(34) reductase QueG [Candidatus Tectomicrobia bacterium RIFCSPLOWO2_02_FULL_70_19]OGL68257.1 MAG: tRNA epoxyqueuosine(34) reductase QueG [Candidatus Tectomicrobia bacterium RIFCSPLOWO2_12_FULL_69_37]
MDLPRPVAEHSPAELARAAKDLARRHGFDLAGIAPPELEEAYDRYREWLGLGYEGEMAYLRRRPEVRSDLRRVWPETRSALVVAIRYRSEEALPSPALLPGKIASYAHGGDYHKFLKKRLLRLLRDLKELDPGMDGRSYVDTGPILERNLAVRAGLGWQGKNSLLLHRALGSYFFLGALLLNRPLPADAPFAEEHCGTCARCIEACPTGAIVAPGVVDARRCISYLTIELRGPMPRELRPLVGAHFFGCDICQEVCPWNADTPPASEPRFAPRTGVRSPDLLDLLEMDEEAFAKRFRGTPVMRSRYDGFLRNVAVAAGNTGGGEAVAPLMRALRHREPLARGHAAWALGRIGRRLGGDAIRPGLEGRLASEPHPWVREEIELALGELPAFRLPALQETASGHEKGNGTPHSSR